MQNYSKEIIEMITAYNPNWESEELEKMTREELKEIGNETLENFYI